MTLDDLLAPVSIDAPAGADLAYDSERQEIEQAFEQASQGGAEIDWRDTVRLIEAQSRRTKDIWLAVYLARAGARLGRLDTVEAGCAMLAGLFDRYWTEVHPTVEEYGLQGRKGPCESLTRIGEFLGPLRRTVLVEHSRLGSFTGEDFERFATQGDAAEGYGLFRAVLNDTPVETLQASVARLDAIRDAIRAADSVLTERAAAVGDTGTNFSPTYEAIEAIRAALAPHAGLEVEVPEAVSADSAADEGATPRSGAPGRVESRNDVVRAIDAIADYYQRREPSSPVPVALRRVRGWVAMDFMAILRDIAPNSLADVGAVLLAKPEDPQGGVSNW